MKRTRKKRAGSKAAAEHESVYEIPFLDAQGRRRTLGEFQGEVLLVVNTASY